MQSNCKTLYWFLPCGVELGLECAPLSSAECHACPDFQYIYSDSDRRLILNFYPSSYLKNKGNSCVKWPGWDQRVGEKLFQHPLWGGLTTQTTKLFPGFFLEQLNSSLSSVVQMAFSALKCIPPRAYFLLLQEQCFLKCGSLRKHPKYFLTF